MANKRNVAVLGSIDSGKTTLTDLLMFLSEDDTRPERGSVDKGTTLTDTGLVEIRRKITIDSVPVQGHYFMGGCEYYITFVDTPGHPNFNYQVRTVLDGVEAAVMLIDMSKGFTSYSAELLAQLKEAELPTMLVFNKTDLIRTDPDKRAIEILCRMERAGFDAHLLQEYDGTPSNWFVQDCFLSSRDTPNLSKPVEHRRSLPFLAQGSFDEIFSDGSMPAVFAAGFYGEGAIELLTYICAKFPDPSTNRLLKSVNDPSDLSIRVLNRFPRKGHLKGPVALRVVSGQLERRTKVYNPSTGEYYKLSHLYSPNGQPITIAASGDIILVTVPKKGDLKTGHTLCAPNSKVYFPSVKVDQPIIGSNISFPPKDDLRLATALRLIGNWDPSWRYTPSDGQLKVFSAGEFHLGIIAEILREEFGLNVESQGFEPRYLAMPVTRGYSSLDPSTVLGLNVKLEVRSSAPYEENTFSSDHPYGKKLKEELQRVFLQYKWHGYFPLAGFDIKITPTSPRSNKSRALEVRSTISQAVQNLLYTPGNVALFEPYVLVESTFDTPEQRNRAVRFFSNFCHGCTLGYRWDSRTFMFGESAELPLSSLIENEVRVRKALKDVIYTVTPLGYRMVPSDRAARIIAANQTPTSHLFVA